jgi:cell division septation protein DedD
MSDEQFHEFHLDGKQMVFLFMASTVVAVVIFLCGVMVGRGVRTDRVEPVAFDAPEPDLSADADSELPAKIDPLKSSLDIPDEFNGPQRLQGASAPPDHLREAVPAPTRGEAAAPPIPEDAPPSVDTKAQASAKPDPAKKDDKGSSESLVAPKGPGYVVQVASVPKLTDAESIRDSLVRKGYKTFITPTPTGPRRYRVRVGAYPTRREAKSIEQKLEKVEKFRDAWTVSL